MHAGGIPTAEAKTAEAPAGMTRSADVQGTAPKGAEAPAAGTSADGATALAEAQRLLGIDAGGQSLRARLAKVAPIAAAQAAEAPVADAASGGTRPADASADGGGRAGRGLAPARQRWRRADPAGAAGQGGPGLARCADLEDRQYPLMQPVSRIEENPFRPRHFRPLPAGAPVVIDERHAVAIEICRGRLVLVAAVFALVFLVVALRLLTMPLLSGGTAEVHAGRVRPAAGAAAAGAGRHYRPQRSAPGDDAEHARRFMPTPARFPMRARRPGQFSRFCLR